MSCTVIYLTFQVIVWAFVHVVVELQLGGLRTRLQNIHT